MPKHLHTTSILKSFHLVNTSYPLRSPIVSQCCDQLCQTHSTNSSKRRLLLFLHRSFTEISKHSSLTVHMPICHLCSSSHLISTPNTILHSRLTVHLPDSPDLDPCLSILFWLSACDSAGSRDFTFVRALEM